MTTDIAVHEQRGALALRPDQQQWTDQQRAALTQLGVDKASPGDLAVFLHVAQRTGLDPFAKQLYMIQRAGKWTIQTGIDGFRVIAARHPEYAGQIGPQWCGKDGVWRDFWIDGKPVAARVGVVRRDWTEPVWGVALFSEFNAGNQMWRDKPAHMLAKVSEALALRKAFPHDLSALHTDDEMGRAARTHVVDHGSPVTVAELTGTPTPARADSPPSPARTAPAAAAPPTPQGPPLPTETEQTGGEGAGPHKPSQEQMRKLFALIREADIHDRMTYASRLLNRDISSYGQLTASDAHQLIDNLEAIVSDDANQTRGET